MISKRLKAVADMVTPGYIAADIGTDHAYVPIYLIEHQISPKVYAMDINEGPIRMAIANVENEGYEKNIEVKQTDGMQGLLPNQVDSVVIAGMGGELIVQIMKESKVNDTVKEFVLSPHKNPEVLRKYLNEQGYRIVKEQMLVDAGKYYVILKVIHGREEPFSELELQYGRYLIREKNPVLKNYLKLQKKKFSEIYEVMQEQNSENILEIVEKLQNLGKVLEKM